MKTVKCHVVALCAWCMRLDRFQKVFTNTPNFEVFMAYKKGTVRLSAAFTEAEYKQLMKIVKLYGCRSVAAYFRLKLKSDVSYWRGELDGFTE